MTKIHRRAEEKKKALDMRYEKGMTYAEVSKATGIPTSTLKSWVQRGTKPEDHGSKELRNTVDTSMNPGKQKSLRPVKIEIVARRKDDVDKDAKAEIRELQMQVALLRDFLSLKERR